MLSRESGTVLRREPNPRTRSSFQDPISLSLPLPTLFKMPPSDSWENLPSAETHPNKKGWSKGGRERTGPLSAPRHTPQARNRFQAVWLRVTASPPPSPPAPSRRSFFWPPGGSTARGAADTWDPPASASPLPVHRPRWGTPGRSTGHGAPGGPGGWCSGDLGRRRPL